MSKRCRYATIFAVAFCVAIGAISLSRIDNSFALIWPVNAVVIAAMILRNTDWGEAMLRLAAGMAGVTAANLWFDVSPIAAIFAVANAVECAVVFYAIACARRALERSPEAPHYIILFLALGAAGPLLAGTVASVSGVLEPGSDRLGFILRWALTDALGILVFMPAILLALAPGLDDTRPRALHLVLSVALGAVIGYLANGAVPHLSLLLPTMAAFGIVTVLGLVSGFAFVASFVAVMVLLDLRLGFRIEPSITGVLVLDVQLVAAATAVAAMLAASIRVSRIRTQRQRDEARRAFVAESRVATALRSAIHQFPDATMLFDAGDRLVDHNRACHRLLPELKAHLQPDARLATLVASLDHPPEILRDLEIADPVDRPSATGQSAEYRLPGGEWRLVKVSRLDDGGRLVVVSDISRQKELEAALKDKTKRAQAAVEAKNVFLENMSHELRTPMNGVIGMAQALHTTELHGSQRKMVDVILKSGDLLMRQLNDLLDAAQNGRLSTDLDLRPFSPAELFQTQFDLFRPPAEAKGLDFRIALGPGCHRSLEGDQERLAQVVTNLLSNAIKFTEKGSITLSADVTPTTTGNMDLIVSVADSGPGVAVEDRERLFGRFEQTAAGAKAGGAGLGLSICRAICEAHGGTIIVDDAPGGGALFRARLPLHAVAEAVA